ncbi:MAG: hypothetical protein CMM50_05475 [Rhodospirillaceae bacterium]|nr:hypothetical protein [Rhodospirillaceae bacterium]
MTVDGGGYFKQLPLFAGIAEESISRLESHAEFHTFPRGAVIQRQGSIPTALPVLLEGSVQLLGCVRTQRPVVVDIVRAVEILHLAPVLSTAPVPTTIQVVDPATTVMIPRAAVHKCLSSDAHLAYRLLTILGSQYEGLVSQVKNLKARTASQRLAAYLVELAEDRGARVVRLPFDKRLLASRLGMTPESFSRALSTLRTYEVETRSSEVHIGDFEKLRQYALPDGEDWEEDTPEEYS